MNIEEAKEIFEKMYAYVVCDRFDSVILDGTFNKKALEAILCILRYEDEKNIPIDDRTF